MARIDRILVDDSLRQLRWERMVDGESENYGRGGLCVLIAMQVYDHDQGGTARRAKAP